jgi:hypothetical protein
VDSFQANSHLGSEQCVLNGLGVMPIDFRHMPAKCTPLFGQGLYRSHPTHGPVTIAHDNAGVIMRSDLGFDRNKRSLATFGGGTDMIAGPATASASQARPKRSDASIPIRTIASLLRAHQAAEH